ncbi:hypothetical protein NC652_017412 [Populus alba x Populus x berolinensis]|nr:hypothetical protein NC652_017412 [Populus alba x Populus x berolinensis]
MFEVDEFFHFNAVKLNANRMVVGTLRGFDQFMNLVVDNTVEVNGDEKTDIGMVVIRGNSVVTVEALEPAGLAFKPGIQTPFSHVKFLRIEYHECPGKAFLTESFIFCRFKPAMTMQKSGQLRAVLPVGEGKHSIIFTSLVACDCLIAPSSSE